MSCSKGHVPILMTSRTVRPPVTPSSSSRVRVFSVRSLAMFSRVSLVMSLFSISIRFELISIASSLPGHDTGRGAGRRFLLEVLLDEMLEGPGTRLDDVPDRQAARHAFELLEGQALQSLVALHVLDLLGRHLFFSVQVRVTTVSPDSPRARLVFSLTLPEHDVAEETRHGTVRKIWRR